MIRSNYSTSGLLIGQDDVNMTYAYGLSDFFSVMFEDTSLPNLLLESDTLVASEVYSRFLQLTSGMSLEDVQVSIGSQIKLVLLNSSDLVPGTLATYKLPIDIVSSRYIANRPLLPTELLESKVDFDLSQDDTGQCYVQFAKLLGGTLLSPGSDYAFSTRVLSDGSTQYAIWFVDAHVDERLISSCFGKLISISERSSSEDFASFVYGLYYVYTHGPTLTAMRRGLNLVLGMPLARMQETVLDIRMYLQTDQYIVVTDQNQYVIPYGLPPSVQTGDMLQVGQEIAKWVEVKDYESDGDWWLNLYIPSTVVPSPPSGELSRYAVAGGAMDYIMREYLKTHTFLVRVNVTTFKNNQTFSELFSIIQRSKPAYAQPVYVWAVASDEVVNATDEGCSIGINHSSEYDLGNPYQFMTRNSSSPLDRGAARFIRFNAPSYAQELIGELGVLNSSNNNVQSIEISGYSNTKSVLGGNSWEEIDWLRTLASRSSDTWRGRRDQVGYRRGDLVTSSTPARVGSTWSGEALVASSVPLYSVFPELPEGHRIVPLTVMSYEELDSKLGIIGATRPAGMGRFTLPAYDRTRSINTEAVHYPVIEAAASSLWPTATVPTPLEVVKFLGVRSYSIAYEDPVQDTIGVAPGSMNKDVCASMLYQGGEAISYASEGDVLLFCGVTCQLVAVYLVTQDPQSSLPSFLTVDSRIESASAETVGLTTRGMALHSSPAYFRRGSLSFSQSTLSDLEDPSTEVANFLYSEGVSEAAKILPLTFITSTEMDDKTRFWGIDAHSTSRYSLLPHPYPYRLAAEKGMRRAKCFVALSPSLNKMYQDSLGTIPVTGMEQPVGLMEDRYGFGASASQEVLDYRPVVRARYNLLRFTTFEGAVQSSGVGNPGVPPTDWAIDSSTPEAYINKVSGRALGFEANAGYIVISRVIDVPANLTTKFRLTVALNSNGLPLAELISASDVYSGLTIDYRVDGITVDPTTYIPPRDTVVIAYIRNTLDSEGAVTLRFGLGVRASTINGAVTGTVSFHSPDYRHDLGPSDIPDYQRVGDPIPGTSLVSGIADYEVEGFPPYLYFDGVNDSLSVLSSARMDSDKATIFANVVRSSRHSYGRPVELWSNIDVAAYGRLLQEDQYSILTEDILANIALESIVKVGLTWPTVSQELTSNLVATVVGWYNQYQSYTTSGTSLPSFGTYSAVIDTAGELPSREMQVYVDGSAPNGTRDQSGPLSTFVFTNANMTIGSAGESGDFFEGNIYGVVAVGTALTVDERAAVEEWINKEMCTYAYKESSSLYGYPDFFRRDSFPPKIPQAPSGNIYEYLPSHLDVDMDWGYDKVLAYRYTRDVVGLYLVTERNTVYPSAYWSISYSGVPVLTRVSNGQPEQAGLVVVDPFQDSASLNYDYANLSADSSIVNSPLPYTNPVYVYSDSLNTAVEASRGGMRLRQLIQL